MTIAAGTIEYSLSTAKSYVKGIGLSLLLEELDAALEGSVANSVFDEEGIDNLTTLLESVVDTEFDRQEVKRVLESNQRVQSWRVGEALAESYLDHHRDCYFPWPDSRDERKSGSSLPGADLVGLQQKGDELRFAFGEVKTSSDKKYPPTAMYGRTGLKQQLEDLRDKVTIRDDLVKYLGHRAHSSSWRDHYRAASKRYISDNADVSLFGILIRDVQPHEGDLRARVNTLCKDCPDATGIELLAIYSPEHSIESLGEKVVAIKKGGPAQ